jgi:hypothetical protein
MPSIRRIGCAPLLRHWRVEAVAPVIGPGNSGIRFHETGANRLKRLVLLEGIELSTSPLPRECSTTELQQPTGLFPMDYRLSGQPQLQEHASNSGDLSAFSDTWLTRGSYNVPSAHARTGCDLLCPISGGRNRLISVTGSCLSAADRPERQAEFGGARAQRAPLSPASAV